MEVLGAVASKAIEMETATGLTKETVEMGIAGEEVNKFSKPSSTFNPDERIVPTENQRTSPDNRQYDPDRRVDATQQPHEKDAQQYDPDKRIEKQPQHEKGENVENRQHGLTEEEKKELKKETGWSNEIINSIGSKQEAEIYKKAGLKEAEINGKKCLTRNDITMEQKDEYGRINKERMENGLAPITKNGETVELHHIGQKANSPLAELTMQEHRGKGNDTILHDKQKISEINREIFAKERENHWENRAQQLNE